MEFARGVRKASVTGCHVGAFSLEPGGRIPSFEIILGNERLVDDAHLSERDIDEARDGEGW